MKLAGKLAVLSGIGALLAGCSGVATRTAQEPSVLPPYKGGGYYMDDGPGANPPPNLQAVPDAVPRPEPLHRFANDAYRVKGRRYVPDVSGQPYRAEGLASWYGRKFHGKPTASGEPYDMYAMTAAHKTLPIPSYARVTNLDNGRSVVVRINDRGPFHEDRIIDLSYTAAYKLDLLKGVSRVEVEGLVPDAGDAPDSFAALSAETGGQSTTPEPVVAAPPVAAAQQAVPSPQASADGAIFLQLGAYSNPASADGLMARIVQKLGRRVPGVIRQEVGGLYKVQAGPYASAAEAEQAAAHLAEATGIQPYKVISRPAPAVEAARAAQPGAATPVATRGGPAHWVQLAAFANPQSADRLIERLRGHTELPGLERLEAGGLVKVQAGPYAEAALADEAAIRLAADLGHKPYRLVR